MLNLKGMRFPKEIILLCIRPAMPAYLGVSVLQRSS